MSAGPDLDECVNNVLYGRVVGDPLSEALYHPPSGECLDFTTSIVYLCSDVSTILGVGNPEGYGFARITSNMGDPSCVARGAQYCAVFFAAGADAITLHDLRVDATVWDLCTIPATKVFSASAEDKAAVVFSGAPSFKSACGPSRMSSARAEITLTDKVTSRPIWAGTSSIGYLPEGQIWVGVPPECGSYSECMMTVRHGGDYLWPVQG